MDSSRADAHPDLTGMRCLVLGGSVFVGKHLVEMLVSCGARTAVLNRGITPLALPDHVEHLRADRTDQEQMRAVLGGREWELVFDVSGFVMAAGGSDADALFDLFDGRVGRYVLVSSIMAYDQSAVGLFPWTEDQPLNPADPSTYGGFKALVERRLLERRHRTGFPGSIARPAAIYGPDNNIYDMETPMFLRLRQGRPILVPHRGLVVGSWGHVDDLCHALVAIGLHPRAVGEVFNVSTDSIDVNRYIATLAEVVGVEPNVVYIPDGLVDEITERSAPPVCCHLFQARHHAMLSTAKLRDLVGVEPRYDLRRGHEHTYEWFLAQGWDTLEQPLVDPVWRATWDFAAESALAARITDG